MKNIFENTEFNSLFNKVKDEIKPLLDTHQQNNKTKLMVEEVVMWQKSRDNIYFVTPTEKCPNEIRSQVLDIIYKFNPNNK